MFACAPTGSGKTLAFIVPILTHLKVLSVQYCIPYSSHPPTLYFKLVCGCLILSHVRVCVACLFSFCAPMQGPQRSGFRAVVLSPTRELAQQVSIQYIYF